MSETYKFQQIARRVAFAALCLAVLGPAFAPQARADEHDKRSVITFSESVEIPGRVLPAGTYVFKLLDSTDRSIVQVFDKDETTIYGTVMAIPDYRLSPAGEAAIQFEERPAGTPMAIKAWFYPGDTYGEEFVYLHDQTTGLAKQHKQATSTNETGTN
jgi:hypothetical protein